MKKVREFVLLGLAILFLAQLALGTGPQHEKVVFLTYQETMAFDPANYSDSTQTICIINTYDSLLYPVEGGDPEPRVAESWEVSEDNKTYIFEIREGIVFHDGTDLTAEDVAFSMRRILDLNRGWAWVWQDVFDPEDVEATGEYEVTFRLKEVYGPFISTLVLFHIVSKDAILEHKKPGDYGEFGDYGCEYLQDHDAGSGAYEATYVSLGDRITFTRFEDYWQGWEENQIHTVEYRVEPEISSIKLAMQTGEGDIATKGLPLDIMKTLAISPGVKVIQKPSGRVFTGFMNNQKPPFDDINIRKAVAYSIDYDIVIEHISYGSQAIGPVPSAVPGHSDDATVYYKDLDMARMYLERSKYTAEELAAMEIEFYFTSAIEEFNKLALLVKDNLAEIGLNVYLTTGTFGHLRDRATNPESSPHLTCVWIEAKYASASYFLSMMYTPSGWGAYPGMCFYENPEVTEVVNQANSTADPEEQSELYARAQKLISEDAPALWLSNPPLLRPMAEHITGLTYPGVISYDMAFYTLRIER